MGVARRPEQDPAKAVPALEVTLRPGPATDKVQSALAGGHPGALGGAVLRRVGRIAGDLGAGLARGEGNVSASPVRGSLVPIILAVPFGGQKQE